MPKREPARIGGPDTLKALASDVEEPGSGFQFGDLIAAELRGLADALDALKNAVTGCDGPMVVRWDGSGKKCGSPTDIHDRRLCRKCMRKRDDAIKLLIGDDDAR